jgi:poly-gamma-glutamate synthesis protein (capsule biosynthesis protein)
MIVIAFTGVIVPARCVQAGIDERGGDPSYLYDGVRNILTSADITVGVYNATMSYAVEHVGCENTWELVGSPENADALVEAGFDVMSVATNHIKDCGKKYCGDVAFLDTLRHFDRVGIQTVGAGNNLEEALQPVFVEVKGVRFGFVSLGEVAVNERVFAGNQNPGIANLTRRNLENAIGLAAEDSDVVIVLPHSGPEDFPEVTPQQYYWARYSVAFGADLVVTNHAHVLQGYEEIDGVPVFYSMGNFVFDQSVERGLRRDHQQGAILLVKFDGGEMLGFELIPTSRTFEVSPRLPNTTSLSSG